MGPDPRPQRGRRRRPPGRPWPRWSGCRSTRPTASPALASTIRDRALLDPPAADHLLARLGVSLRGLDARSERPDAVVMLCDGAASGATPLADGPSRSSIYGRETAIIDLDLSGLTDDSSISTLLGSAPGLIGSDRPLPLHELRRTPWSGRPVPRDRRLRGVDPGHGRGGARERLVHRRDGPPDPARGDGRDPHRTRRRDGQRGAGGGVPRGAAGAGADGGLRRRGRQRLRRGRRCPRGVDPARAPRPAGRAPRSGWLHRHVRRRVRRLARRPPAGRRLVPGRVHGRARSRRASSPACRARRAR